MDEAGLGEDGGPEGGAVGEGEGVEFGEGLQGSLVNMFGWE